MGSPPRTELIPCLQCGVPRPIRVYPQQRKLAYARPCLCCSRQNQKTRDDLVVDFLIDGVGVKATPAERLAAVAYLTERKLSARLIAERLHCTQRTVQRYRQRYKRKVDNPPMTNPSPAVQFFYDNAAYTWDAGAGQTEQAGHLASALVLANAEQVAAVHGWGVIWSADEATGRMFAILEDADGVPLQTLAGVEPGAEADESFRRVVTAQLALDFLGGWVDNRPSAE